MIEPNATSRKDFLISYTSADRLWAEWITWQLEEAGYSTILRAWDAQLEQSFAQNVLNASKEAERTIAVLSPDYLNALFTEAEWPTAFRKDPTHEEETLLPVHVEECRDRLKGLLSLIVYINLVGLDEQQAREALLAGVNRTYNRPKVIPDFGAADQHSVDKPLRFPGSFLSISNVPRHNPFFTGREDVLKYLHDAYASSSTMVLGQPQAISGLGGIGKTQTAIEYAYRYRSDYQAVLWVMANSQETLVSDFLSIAHLLKLPEKESQDQNEVIDAVKLWLEDHVGWLLVFDNADDLSLVKDFMPTTKKGHVLLTTRSQATSRIARGLYLEVMTPEEGALFLLRRAGSITFDTTLDQIADADRAAAINIVQTLGGLPLALDQAGAYIEETGCSIAEYLERYHHQRDLLLQRRGALATDHPEPVTTTWELSFKKVQQANPTAAELLRFCAFLQPDAIPEEIITEGTRNLDTALHLFINNPLQMDAAIAELRRYSLLRRNSENRTLVIHRLVQAVLRDEMDKHAQRYWAERTVRAVNQVFPEVDFTNWQRCQRYLSQAQNCAAVIDQWNMAFPEAARLLNQAGSYLEIRGQYREALPLYQQALAIYEQVQGPNHPDTAAILHALGSLYQKQGRYEQAEPLYERALHISEQTLGPNHPATAAILHALGILYQKQGQYEQAQPLYERALYIHEQVQGPNHPATAATLYELARLYQDQGRYEQAQPLYERALQISEQTLGPGHPNTASILNNLAELYESRGRYEEALPLVQRALTIREQELGPDHPNTASSLSNLAELYESQSRYEEALPLYQRALAICEQALGPEHPNTASSLNNLARLYVNRGQYEEAQLLYERALAIRERVLRSEHPDTASVLSNLAWLYAKQSRYTEAEPLYRRALQIFEQALGPEHPNNVIIMYKLANLLRETQRLNEALVLEAQDSMIQSRPAQKH